MKTIFSTIILVLVSFLSFTQTGTFLATVTGWPNGIVINGNDLYVAEAATNDILKIDRTLTNPSGTVVTHFLGSPTSLLKFGSEIYITENDSSRVSKIDLNGSLNHTIVAEGMPNPYGMAVDGDTMYVSSLNGIIYKFSLTATNPAPSVVKSGLDATMGIAIYGSELYYVEYGLRTVSKIDISVNNPVSELVVTLSSEPSDLHLYGSRLFISEFEGTKISQIDLNSSSPIPTDLVTGCLGACGMAIIGTDLYFSEQYNDQVTHFSLSPLSQTEINSELQLELFPNPSNSLINVSSKHSNFDYKIITLLGNKVMNGSCFEYTTSISIESLPKGNYILKTNFSSTPFCKN